MVPLYGHIIGIYRRSGERGEGRWGRRMRERGRKKREEGRLRN